MDVVSRHCNQRKANGQKKNGRPSKCIIITPMQTRQQWPCCNLLHGKMQSLPKPCTETNARKQEAYPPYKMDHARKKRRLFGLQEQYFLCISCHFGPCIANHTHAGQQKHFCLIVIHENGGSNSAQDNTFALVNSRDKNQEQRAESNSSFVFDFANITCFCRLRRISEEETATSSARQVRRRGKNNANLLLRYRSAPSASDWPSR